MSFSRFLRTLQLALKSVMLHKLRSGLTMLGIVFGVFSVIAMLAIGEGASSQAQKQVLELGATNIIVRSIKPPDETSTSSSSSRRSFVLRYGLTRKDLAVISETIPTIIGVVPVRELTQEVRNKQHTLNARVVGSTPEYLDMNHLQMTQGRFLTDQDQKQMANVVVLAHETAQVLFPFESPIGRPVQIASRAYRVIGVTRERTASAAIGGSLSGQDYNKDIYMPLETLQTRLNVNDLFIRRTQGSFSAVSVIYDQITLKVGDSDATTDDRNLVIPTAEVVREAIRNIHGDKNDFSVVVPLELLKQADQIRKIFNIVLGSIAAISLLVGGIGIMNIMLATVTERTREIGIRRALGARRRDIIQQFLTETIVLSGTGGLIGILMGLLTPAAFVGIQLFVDAYVMDQSTESSDFGRLFSGMEPQVAIWSLPLAFGVSVAIGIIFGTYPARAAARLDPIEALRHE